MKIVFYDRNPQLIDAFNRRIVDPLSGLMGYPEFDSVCGDFNDIDLFPEEDEWGTTAVVAPGNSFGIMDGGLDAAIRDRFPDVQKDVWRQIYTSYGGELPVGGAILAETSVDHPHYVIYAPTMRAPREIVDWEVVYDAARAALRAVTFHNSKELSTGKQIRKLFFCGLGTATGGVPYENAAELTALAIESMHTKRIHREWPTAMAKADKIAFSARRKELRPYGFSD